MKRFLQGSAIAAGVGLVGGGAYIASSPQRRRQFSRGVFFWSAALPQYFRYRWEEFAVRNLSDAEKDEAFKRLHRIYAPRALDNILIMRGLYIKLGQFMTTRADYAPPEYLKAFSVLQDAVPARSFSEIRELVTRELGVKSLDEVFLSIDEKPLGAATTGQVHGARLLDGSDVVIKVQYEEVEELFMEDLNTVRTFCEMLQPEMLPMLDEMKKQFMTEFDYAREGWALEEIREGVHHKFAGVHIPKPYRQYCSKRVCVMERLYGEKLVDGLQKYFKAVAQKRGIAAEELMKELQEQGEALRKKGGPSSFQMELYRSMLRVQGGLYNAAAGMWNWTAGWLLPNVAYSETVLPLNHVAIVDKLVKVHGYEVFQMGVFNGDAHPGNILILDDGSTIGLIDYGQVKQLSAGQRRQLAKLILAICADDSQAIVEQFSDMGFETEKNDPWVIERTARFFFEDDTNPELQKRKDGTLMNLQKVMEYLNEEDKTKTIPDYTFMVVRCAMLLRGLASHLGLGVNVAKEWKPFAEQTMKETEWVENVLRLKNAHLTKD